MNIAYYFKNLDASDAIKNYVSDKVSKLQDRFHHVEGVDVRFQLERQNQICEVTVHADSTVFHIKKGDKDLYAAIDNVVDSLNIQVDKHHKRMDDRAIEMDNTAVLPELPNVTIAEESMVRVYDASAKPMDDLEAIMQIQSLRFRFMMYHHMNEKRYSLAFGRPDGNFSIITPAKDQGQYAEHVVKLEKEKLKEIAVSIYPMSRMTIAEAIETLDENNLEFLGFVNEESRCMNVMFHAKNGELSIKRPAV